MFKFVGFHKASPHKIPPVYKPEKDNSERRSQRARERAPPPCPGTGRSVELGPFLPIGGVGACVDHEIAECAEDGVTSANGFVAVLEEDFDHRAEFVDARFAVVGEADGRDRFPRGG